MKFTKKDERKDYTRMLEGIERKTLVHGDRTLLAEFRLEKGSRLPEHSHPHEQTGMLLSGSMRFFVGGMNFLAEPGDSWCIPSEEAHAAEALEDSTVLEVFSPCREDYLE